MKIIYSNRYFKLHFLFFLIAFAIKNSVSYAQKDSATYKHNNQAILAGTWGYTRSIAAVSYERIFSKPDNKNLYFAARAGIGYTPGIRHINLKGIVSIPSLFSVIWGRNKNFIQMAIGYTGSFGQNAIDSTVIPRAKYLKYESSYIVNIGYRFMELKGATFEITPISLIWTNNPTLRFMWSFGFSVGGAF